MDSGNPALILSAPLAVDLGLPLASTEGNESVAPPPGLRLGECELSLEGITTLVMREPAWLFAATHNDANLPSTLLGRHDVVLDYPRRQLTLAPPGSLRPAGPALPASVHPETGIARIEAVVDGDSLGFALDMGASYSLIDASALEGLLQRHPEWPRTTGTMGCANMWGWWPPEEDGPTVARLPEIAAGPLRLRGVGVVGVGELAPGGPSFGAWYSQKTARPVVGLLGANALKPFRVTLCFAGGAVWLEPGPGAEANDLDVVGLAVRTEADGSYRVAGVARQGGETAVPGVEAGDALVGIGDFDPAGATMGAVVDALRGRPGEVRMLLLERDARRFTVEAVVRRFP